MSRRGRTARLRDAGADALLPEPETAVAWSDLAPAEQAALMRLNRGRGSALDETIGARLVALGVAAARPSGIGITRSGRELVIARLLGSGGD